MQVLVVMAEELLRAEYEAKTVPLAVLAGQSSGYLERHELSSQDDELEASYEPTRLAEQ